MLPLIAVVLLTGLYLGYISLISKNKELRPIYLGIAILCHGLSALLVNMA